LPTLHRIRLAKVVDDIGRDRSCFLRDVSGDEEAFGHKFRLFVPFVLFVVPRKSLIHEIHELHETNPTGS